MLIKIELVIVSMTSSNVEKNKEFVQYQYTTDLNYHFLLVIIHTFQIDENSYNCVFMNSRWCTST